MTISYDHRPPQPPAPDFASVVDAVAQDLSDFVDANPEPYRSRWSLRVTHIYRRIDGESPAR